MSYSVKQVASWAAVTVRTLHHYDRTGLLTPSTRSRAGYRLYDETDLARLQRLSEVAERAIEVQRTGAAGVRGRR